MKDPKKAAIAKIAKKVEAAEKLAERFLLATRELHNSLMEVWDAENKLAIGAIHAALLDHKRICFTEGCEVIGWSNGSIEQADTILMVLDRFEALFKNYLPEKGRSE